MATKAELEQSRVAALHKAVSDVTGKDYSGDKPRTIHPFPVQVMEVDNKVAVLLNMWMPEPSKQVGGQPEVRIGNAELWHLLIQGMEQGFLDRRQVGKWLKQAKREHKVYVGLVRQKLQQDRRGKKV